jgi:hypothetical protein
MPATSTGTKIHASDTQVGSSYVLFCQKVERLPEWMFGGAFDKGYFLAKVAG